MNIIKQLIYQFKGLWYQRKFKSRLRKSIIRGWPIIINNGRLRVGRSLKINSGKKWNLIGGQDYFSLVVLKGGKLIIGDNLGISNSSIVCSNSITIGRNVVIGGSVCIYDTDFHSLDENDRCHGNDVPKSKEVYIGDNCFIGTKTIILKGSRIGSGTIVGAGSVVTGELEENSIYAGNPIKKIK